MTSPAVGLSLNPVPAHLLLEAAMAAEHLGYESVWLGEHIVVPMTTESEYPSGSRLMPFDHTSPFLDPMMALSSIAAVTRHVRLGIGAYLMPLRHPIIAAKQFVTLDHMSSGRLDFVVGVGWMAEEFDALGVRFDDRGKRTDRALELFDRLFHDEIVEYSSPEYVVPPMAFSPKPLAGPPRSRVIGGGYSGPAFSRAARCAGWHGSLTALGPPATTYGSWHEPAVGAFVELIRAERARLDPDADYVVSGVLTVPPTSDDLQRLGALGVDRVVVNPWGQVDGKHVGTATSTDEVFAFADRVGLQPPAAQPG